MLCISFSVISRGGGDEKATYIKLHVHEKAKRVVVKQLPPLSLALWLKEKKISRAVIFLISAHTHIHTHALNMYEFLRD